MSGGAQTHGPAQAPLARESLVQRSVAGRSQAGASDQACAHGRCWSAPAPTGPPPTGRRQKKGHAAAHRGGDELVVVSAPRRDRHCQWRHGPLPDELSAST